MNTNGIPTVGPLGIQMRSRIEAKWAWMFHENGMDAQYEPVDLNGYIPDFILSCPNMEVPVELKGSDKVLVEIKGSTDLWKPGHYEEHIQKIRKSGWKGLYLLLGSNYQKMRDDTVTVGILGTITDSPATDRSVHAKIRFLKNQSRWAFVSLLLTADRYSIIALGATERDIIDSTNTEQRWKEAWAVASNRTQWKGSQDLHVQEHPKQPTKLEHELRIFQRYEPLNILIHDQEVLVDSRMLSAIASGITGDIAEELSVKFHGKNVERFETKKEAMYQKAKATIDKNYTYDMFAAGDQPNS
jgi:hypothetical protein